MTSPVDPAVVVQKVLDAVAPSANRLPDPFSEDVTAPGRCNPTLPIRLRGLIGRLAQQERELRRSVVRQQSKVKQVIISRGFGNSTVLDGELREVFRQELQDRRKSREQWFCEQSREDATAIDSYCLAILDSVTGRLFLADIPAVLHGSLSRLALEYAFIIRRTENERREREKSLVQSGRNNPIVMKSMLQGLSYEEDEAKQRLIEQWFRELTPDQASAFDMPMSAGTPPLANTCTDPQVRNGSKPVFDGMQQGEGRKPQAEAGLTSTKGKNINARMLVLLNKDRRHYDWSAKQFAEHLDCAESTVKGTIAWEQIMKSRAISEAERTSPTGTLNGGRRKRKAT